MTYMNDRNCEVQNLDISHTVYERIHIQSNAYKFASKFLPARFNKKVKGNDEKGKSIGWYLLSKRY